MKGTATMAKEKDSEYIAPDEALTIGCLMNIIRACDSKDRTKLKAYRLLTVIQSCLINRVLQDLEKQLKKKRKNHRTPSRSNKKKR